MEKIRLGIIGTSDIAFRRFLPALMKSTLFDYVGIASRNYYRTKKFVELYGGKGYKCYDDLIKSEEVEALYLPLPPALHYEWTKKSLENKKHVFVEKPFTTKINHTKELIELARKENLGLFENYGFVYHSQLEYILKLIFSKKLGKIRLYRLSFGFPLRQLDDFRYNKKLGGGSLLDCGGYPLKLAIYLLGKTTQIKTAKLNYEDSYNVDLYGSATLENDLGQVAQIAFGMDNSYRCEFEAWCSNGVIIATRIFTAAGDYKPELIIKEGNTEKKIILPTDDQFLKSIDHFADCIHIQEIRELSYKEILYQGKAVETIKLKGGYK